MNRRLIAVATGAAAVLGLVITYHLGRAQAGGIPTTNTLAYSGTLLDNGQPEAGSHFIILKMYAAGDLTNPACSTLPAGNTQLINGRFTIPLDASCVPIVHQHSDVQVEVVVDGTSMGKTPLAAVPYAVEADTASNFAPGSAIASLVPAGTIVAYAGVAGGAVNPPPGWLLCDGSAVSRTTYGALYAAIGSTAGGGDGATTFNLPDYRGRFLRGVDDGTGRDPDAAGRTAMASGGNTGPAVGTVEGFEFTSHNHGVNDGGHQHAQFVTANPGACPGSGIIRTDYTADTPGNACGYAQGIDTDLARTGITIANAGGSETRPVNAAVNYLVKY